MQHPAPHTTALLHSAQAPVIAAAFVLALVALGVQLSPLPYPRISRWVSALCYVSAVALALALVLPARPFVLGVIPVGTVLLLAYAWWLWLTPRPKDAVDSAASPRPTPMHRSSVSPGFVKTRFRRRSRLAWGLSRANAELRDMVVARSLDAPDKPLGALTQEYAGPPDYERETVRLFRDEYRPMINPSLHRAVKLGYGEEGWSGLPDAVLNDVDEIWRVIARTGKVVRMLKSGEKPSHVLADRVMGLIEVGSDIRGGLVAGDTVFAGYTAHQAFITWHYDVHWLLTHEGYVVAGQRMNEGKPLRGSSYVDLISAIDLALSELATVNVA